MERESSRRGNVAAEFHDWPDEVLLAEYVHTHDERLFREIVQRHEQMIESECWRVLHHRQDVEFAAQQTWLVLLQKAATIRNGESLKSWLQSTTFGEACNIRKKKRRREGHEQFDGELAQLAQLAQLAPSDDAAEARETLGIITTKVQRLSEKLRVPFVLHCLEGKSKREVAQELGLPEGTVASRVRQARKLLRKRLECHGITPS